MVIYNDYIHEYDFPFHNFLTGYIKLFIQKKLYLDSKYLSGYGGNDFVVDNEEIINFLVPKLNNIIEENFEIPYKPAFSSYLNVYVQNKYNYKTGIHNHCHQPTTLVGVFYANIPKLGGELEFFHPPFFDSLKIKPKINKLYVFPSWLYHEPKKQNDDDWRISFNWYYPLLHRLKHKKTGVVF